MTPFCEPSCVVNGRALFTVRRLENGALVTFCRGCGAWRAVPGGAWSSGVHCNQKLEVFRSTLVCNKCGAFVCPSLVFKFGPLGVPRKAVRGNT